MRIQLLLATALLVALAGCSTTNSRLVTCLNRDAAIVGNIPVNPLNWAVITSGVDRKNSIMFTVFGNDVAVEYARTTAGQDYPAGSAIALSAWHQQQDSRWFGGKIPARVISIEFLTFTPAGDGGTSRRYRAYKDFPLRETRSSKSQAEPRAAYILSLRGGNALRN
jgi:hypothetical protein